MDDLINIGFRVRGIVTDNHTANVVAFKLLLNEMPGDNQQYFIHRICNKEKRFAKSPAYMYVAVAEANKEKYQFGWYLWKEEK